MTTDPSLDTADFSWPPTLTEPPWPPPVSCRVRVELAALSHPGRVREKNEDAYLVARFGRFLDTLHTNVPAGQVPDRSEEVGYGLLVADGVGGSAAGEVASRLAVSTLIGLVLETPDWVLRAGEPEDERAMQRMADRYRQIDAALKEHAETDPDLAGMGTTMTLAVSLGTRLIVAHVGDSRAYLLDGTGLHQLTRDHTLAQELMDVGVISAEEALTHRFRHALTRALGGRRAFAKADVDRVRLGDGDQVLLCSDGLTDMVDDAAIAAALRDAGTAAEACRALVDAALANGGKDNVTVALARYQFPHDG
jgi:protein phosphatase